MITHLKKLSVDEKKIVYQYSPEQNKNLDGLVEINLENNKYSIKPAEGDENGTYGRMSVGKIMLWNKQGALPDEYVICTG